MTPEQISFNIFCENVHKSNFVIQREGNFFFLNQKLVKAAKFVFF